MTEDHSPTVNQKDEWVRSNNLREANPSEILKAKRTEVPVLHQRAISPSGKFYVAFHMGRLRTKNGSCTTTSYYALTDAQSNRILAKVQSTLFDEMGRELGFKQKCWFSPDERLVLINEEWHDGAAAHSMTALFSADAKQSSWSFRYLALPEYPNYWGVPEHGPTPVGLIDDTILFDPLVSDKFYKKLLIDVPEAEPPLPFSIG